MSSSLSLHDTCDVKAKIPAVSHETANVTITSGSAVATDVYADATSSPYIPYDKSELQHLKSHLLRPGQRLKGSDLKGVRLWILLTEDLKDRHYQYKEGLNVLLQPWKPRGVFDEGGLRATYHYPAYIKEEKGNNQKISRVEIPDDADVWVESYKALKVTALILVKIELVKEADIHWKSLLEQDYTSLSYIPMCRRTDDIYLASVKKYGLSLKDIPKEKITPEMVMIAVSNQGLALCHVPNEMKTKDVIMTAVSKDGFALRYVPKEMLTMEMIMTAIKQDGCALCHVPKEMITTEVILAAVMQNGWALKSVPREMLTKEVLMSAVTLDRRALLFFPYEMQMSVKVIKDVVSQNGLALSYVHPSKMIHQVFTAAVLQDCRALHFVPHKMRTKELVMSATTLSKYGRYFTHDDTSSDWHTECPIREMSHQALSSLRRTLMRQQREELLRHSVHVTYVAGVGKSRSRHTRVLKNLQQPRRINKSAKRY
jgi:hypothetical protein